MLGKRLRWTVDAAQHGKSITLGTPSGSQIMDEAEIKSALDSDSMPRLNRRMSGAAGGRLSYLQRVCGTAGRGCQVYSEKEKNLKHPPESFETRETFYEFTREIYRIKVKKDGLICTITVELDGKTLGLPTSDSHTPSRTWQQHSHRPSNADSITPDSEGKLKDIDFEFLREIKHPDTGPDVWFFCQCGAENKYQKTMSR